MNKTLILLILIVTLLFYGCKNNNEEPFTGSGTFDATEIIISAQTGGELIKINFKEGDHVIKGSVLVEIDLENLQLQRKVTAAGLDELIWNDKVLVQEIAAGKEAIKQAFVTLENIRKTHQRFANLVEQGAATQDKLDNVMTELSVAESRFAAAKDKLTGLEAQTGINTAARKRINAQLDLLDYQISKSRVICPDDGIVLEKYTEEGELANPGTPLCSIADLSTMRLTIYVSENMIGNVKLGSRAQITIDSLPDRTFEGKVTWISQEAEFTPKNVQTRESRVDLVYAVKITIDNPDGIFKIGMPADAYIEGI
ncbi:MAG: efflux RND transporter periplasmic adaptor subunit [Candidatus Latescibacteria bacterium]|nr:efflux RND transporter periplasmic adaptor subunit [Candidatus Latescibacterota bacterium]